MMWYDTLWYTMIQYDDAIRYDTIGKASYLVIFSNNLIANGYILLYNSLTPCQKWHVEHFIFCWNDDGFKWHSDLWGCIEIQFCWINPLQIAKGNILKSFLCIFSFLIVLCPPRISLIPVTVWCESRFRDILVCLWN